MAASIRGDVPAWLPARLPGQAEAIGAGLVVQNTVGEVVACNVRALELLGLTWEQLTGEEQPEASWTLLGADGIPLPSGQEPSVPPWRGDTRATGPLLGVRTAEGADRLRWLRVDATPHPEDPTEPRLGVWAFYFDVTDEDLGREAEGTLQNDYFLLAERSTDVVGRFSPTGEHLWISPSTTRVFGYQPHELQGRNAAEFIHPADIERVTAAVTAGIEQPTRYRYRFRAADGSYRHVESTSVGIFSKSGQLLEFQITTRDISERVLYEERLASAMAQSPVGLALVDENGTVEDLNPAYCRIIGRSADEVVGRPFVDLVDPADAHAVTSLIRPASVDVVMEVRHLRPNRESVWTRLHAGPVSDANGNLVHVTLHAVDISSEMAVTRALAKMTASEERFRMTVMGSAVASALLDLEGRIIEANPALVEYLRLPREEVAGRSVREFASTEVWAELAAGFEQLRAGSRDSVRSRGEWESTRGEVRWGDASVSLILTDAKPLHFVLQLVDVTREQSAMAELEHRSSHDALTGLPNRSEVHPAILRAQDFARTSNTAFALLYVDVDNFKAINDGLSHGVGDAVLQGVAERLRGALRASDLVCRIGGDEFLVVLADLRNEDEAALMAQDLRAVAAAEIIVEGARLRPTISIGVAMGDQQSDSHELLRKADTALSHAKQRGRDRAEFYSLDMSRDAAHRLALEAELLDSVAQDRVRAWFQPVVDLRNGDIAGYEALARTVDLQGNARIAADFIQVAEETGIIVPLGWTVIRQAVEVAARIPSDRVMGINASASQINHPDFHGRLLNTLADCGVATDRIVLELTEHAVFRLSPWARRGLEDLATQGVKVYIDDFGTGFSSISHLRDLPVAGIKLDRSFTEDIDSVDSLASGLARGLADLARGLGVETVAEGIETAEQTEILTELGWHYGQGWYFGRPAPSPATS